MNCLRYFLRAIASAALSGRRLSPRYVAVLMGRAIGGALAGRVKRPN